MTTIRRLTWDEIGEASPALGEWEPGADWCLDAWSGFEEIGLADYENASGLYVALTRAGALFGLYSDFYNLAIPFQSTQPDYEALTKNLQVSAKDLTDASEDLDNFLTSSGNAGLRFRARCAETRPSLIEPLKEVFGGLSGIMQSLLRSLPEPSNIFCTEDEFGELINSKADIETQLEKYISELRAKASRWVGEGCPNPVES